MKATNALATKYPLASSCGYSGGRVKRPESVPIDIFLREMRFFQVTMRFRRCKKECPTDLCISISRRR
ncbi:hypothetical protein NECAME_03785 [Necator americanus]|uniref:Uncharacterized protein n=1 Tax=Necator americanus TaxID=51031 RepID=W2T0I5_NECAM|nr:hypothetical protein NECAME_03785 [Necator americanus]ETN75403.1 hypothetical protein NECAME_03785 [Necator americanus]